MEENENMILNCAKVSEDHNFGDLGRVIVPLEFTLDKTIEFKRLGLIG